MSEQPATQRIQDILLAVSAVVETFRYDVGHRLASMACSDSNVPLRRTAWRFIASAGNRCPSQDACIGICRLANVGGRKFLSRQMVLMQFMRAGLLAEDDSGAWFCISE